MIFKKTNQLGNFRRGIKLYVPKKEQHQLNQSMLILYQKFQMMMLTLE